MARKSNLIKIGDAINQLFKKGLENKKAEDEKEKKYVKQLKDLYKTSNEKDDIQTRQQHIPDGHQRRSWRGV